MWNVGGRETCCLRLSNSPPMYRWSVTYYNMFYRRTNTSEIQRRFGTGPDLPPPTPTWIISRRWQWSAGHCRGQQRGTEKQTSPTSPQNWTRRRHLRGSGSRRRSSSPFAPPSPPRFRMCLHFVEMCTAHVKAHETVSKRGEKKNKNTQPRDWGTKNHTWSITESLAFFLRFIFYRGGVRTCDPTPEPLYLALKTVSCHGNFSGQCSPCCCSCSALWDLRFGTLNVLSGQKKKKKIARPSAKPTNFCCILSLCERSLGTFACCPAQKTSKGHLDIVLFLFVRVCVCAWGLCMRVFNDVHPMWKQKTPFNHRLIWWQTRRPLISSCSMQWIRNARRKWKWNWIGGRIHRHR